MSKQLRVLVQLTVSKQDDLSFVNRFLMTLPMGFLKNEGALKFIIFQLIPLLHK